MALTHDQIEWLHDNGKRPDWLIFSRTERPHSRTLPKLHEEPENGFYAIITNSKNKHGEKRKKRSWKPILKSK